MRMRRGNMKTTARALWNAARINQHKYFFPEGFYLRNHHHRIRHNHYQHHRKFPDPCCWPFYHGWYWMWYRCLASLCLTTKWQQIHTIVWLMCASALRMYKNLLETNFVFQLNSLFVIAQHFCFAKRISSSNSKKKFENPSLFLLRLRCLRLCKCTAVETKTKNVISTFWHFMFLYSYDTLSRGDIYVYVSIHFKITSGF